MTWIMPFCQISINSRTAKLNIKKKTAGDQFKFKSNFESALQYIGQSANQIFFGALEF